MGSVDNINNFLDSGFENHNYLPQRLSLEDIDQSMFDFINNINISINDGFGSIKKVSLIYLTQELWAESKYNWNGMLDEMGKEISKPFMTLIRTSVKRGDSPMKYTIPSKKKFKFLKIPTFNGSMKGYDIYKIPQPVWVDVDYDLVFVTHYMEDVNTFYEKILRDTYSNGQAYLKINGYSVSSVMGQPSEDNEISGIDSERIYKVAIPITVHGKIIDPTDFEKVNTITKIKVTINEKKK